MQSICTSELHFPGKIISHRFREKMKIWSCRFIICTVCTANVIWRIYLCVSHLQFSVKPAAKQLHINIWHIFVYIHVYVYRLIIRSKSSGWVSIPLRIPLPSSMPWHHVILRSGFRGCVGFVVATAAKGTHLRKLKTPMEIENLCGQLVCGACSSHKNKSKCSCLWGSSKKRT